MRAAIALLAAARPPRAAACGGPAGPDDPRMIRRVTLPGTTGHFDHVAVAGGVAFLAAKSNVSFADQTGALTAVRYTGGEVGFLISVAIEGCNPQGVAVASGANPAMVVVSCAHTGDVAVFYWATDGSAEGSVLNLRGRAAAAGGDSDDVWVRSAGEVVVAVGDTADDPAALAYVAVPPRPSDDYCHPAVTKRIPTGGHPEAFRPVLNGSRWAVNVPDQRQLIIADQAAVVRRWDLRPQGCDGGNYAMAVTAVAGREYLVVACRAAPSPKLMVWATADVAEGTAAGVATAPAPLCELKAYDQCDDLHVGDSGAVYASMGSKPTGHIMKYAPVAAPQEADCPLEEQWEAETPGTGSRTSALDSRLAEFVVVSPSPGGYNGTSRGDALLSVYCVESIQPTPSPKPTPPPTPKPTPKPTGYLCKCIGQCQCVPGSGPKAVDRPTCVKVCPTGGS